MYSVVFFSKLLALQNLVFCDRRSNGGNNALFLSCWQDQFNYICNFYAIVEFGKVFSSDIAAPMMLVPLVFCVSTHWICVFYNTCLCIFPREKSRAKNVELALRNHSFTRRIFRLLFGGLKSKEKSGAKHSVSLNVDFPVMTMCFWERIFLPERCNVADCQDTKVFWKIVS